MERLKRAYVHCLISYCHKFSIFHELDAINYTSETRAPFSRSQISFAGTNVISWKIIREDSASRVIKRYDDENSS